jgi:biopolymer transport protein TolQ
MDETAVMEGNGLIELILTANPETQVVLAICVVFSLASWYLIGAKASEFRRLGAAHEAYLRAAERSRTLEERVHATAAVGDSPYADLVHETTAYLDDLRAANERGGVSRTGLSLTQLEALALTLDVAVREATEASGRRIPWLAVVGTTAPLLGLLGTVLGIMQAFLGIARSGSGNIGAVAPGIADALVATAAGLAAAIPAVIFYNIYTARLDRFEGTMERTAQELIGMLGREGKL